MAELSHDQVRHIAKLARLQVNDEEVAKFATQLTSILGYVDMLKEVDTKNVPATAQVTGTHNALRSDVITKPLATREEMLGTSGLSIIDDQIQTPSAHG